MFEDDEYARRLRGAGYRIVCARDSFVHQWMRASFRKMPKREYRELFARNQTLFEQKWGIAWQPHGRPDGATGTKAGVRVNFRSEKIPVQRDDV